MHRKKERQPKQENAEVEKVDLKVIDSKSA